MLDFEKFGREKGKLLCKKNAQYGNSYVKVPAIMKIFYPEGIPIEAYKDATAMVRVLDKLCRRSVGNKEALEDWGDIAGYGLVMEAYEAWLIEQDGDCTNCTKDWDKL